MTVSADPARHPEEHQAVTARLSTLDRFLPVWIGLAMAAGIGLGALLPRLDDWLDELRVGTVSTPSTATRARTEHHSTSSTHPRGRQ